MFFMLISRAFLIQNVKKNYRSNKHPMRWKSGRNNRLAFTGTGMKRKYRQHNIFFW